MTGKRLPRFRVKVQTVLWVALCLCLIVGMDAFAGGTQEQEKTQVDFWWRLDSAEIPFVEDALSVFHQDHPNITVKMQYFARWPEYLQKFQIALASQTVPNLAFMKETYVYDLSPKGATSDLSKFVHKSDVVNRDEIHQAYFDLYAFKGEQIAIPFNGPIMGIFYNRDLFKKAGLDPEKPPQDWNALREYAKRMRIPAEDQWGFAVYEYGTREINLIWFLTFFWEAGGKFWKDDYSGIDLNTAAGKEALQFLVDMIRSDKTVLPPEVPREGLIESSKIAMWMQGNWAMHNYEKYAPNLNYGTAMLPKHKDYGQYIASDGLMIPKAANNKEDAWKVIEFFLRPDINVSFNIRSGFLPVTRDALISPPFSTDPRWVTFVKTLPVARPLPTAEGFAEMAETRINPSLQAAIFQEKTVAQALADAENAANAYWSSIGGSKAKVRVLESYERQP